MRVKIGLPGGRSVSLGLICARARRRRSIQDGGERARSGLVAAKVFVIGAGGASQAAVTMALRSGRDPSNHRRVTAKLAPRAVVESEPTPTWKSLSSTTQSFVIVFQ